MTSNHHFRAIACGLTVAVLAACSGNNAMTPPVSPVQQAAQMGSQPAAAAGNNLREVCAPPTQPDEVQCLSLVRTDIGGATLLGYHGPQLEQAFTGVRPCHQVAPFCPSDLQSAYSIATQSRTRGAGKTVAIVDAYGYPSAESDLGVYRQGMGLSACTSANGCLRIVNQLGQSGSPPPAHADWDGEQALDLDMVSAICPNCHILLVQANTPSFKNLGISVDTAVKLGAVAVSNSYGGNEIGASNKYFTHTGVAITASAGDSGADAQQPCSFSTVVCVGGTSLYTSTDSRGWTEQAWSGTGSGCSALVVKPAWQTDKGCKMRSESDLSAVANPYTGVAVFEAGAGGWLQYGGTSASSPIIAAMFALAGNAKKINAAQWVWQHGRTTGDFNDVTQGSNPGKFVCPSTMTYICRAQRGYDGPTGWGTPHGLGGL